MTVKERQSGRLVGNESGSIPVNRDNMMKTLILGLGNPILSDDGAGFYAAEQLKDRLNGQDITVEQADTGGLAMIDMLYGYDKAIIIDAIQTGKGKTGEIYNIGGGSEVENIKVVKLICDILDEKRLEGDSRLVAHDSRFDELIKFIDDPRGKAHDFRYALDCSKISKNLGWNTTIDFETGLKDTVDWYLKNRDWVNKVTSGEYQEYYKLVYSNRK